MADIELTLDEIAREIGIEILARWTAEKRLRALQQQAPAPETDSVRPAE